MKKLVLIFCILLWAVQAHAQKFSLRKYAQESYQSMNGMSPVVYTTRIITSDEANGYAFSYTTAIYEDKGNNIYEKTEYYTTYGLWKTNGKNLIGRFPITINTVGASTEVDDTLPLSFSDENTTWTDVYDAKQVKAAYEAALEQMAARGLEGTEVFYAEIPRKGTAIGLYIVLGSELKSNKGVPVWKQAFGELIFDKTTGKFTFKQK